MAGAGASAAEAGAGRRRPRQPVRWNKPSWRRRAWLACGCWDVGGTPAAGVRRVRGVPGWRTATCRASSEAAPREGWGPSPGPSTLPHRSSRASAAAPGSDRAAPKWAGPADHAPSAWLARRTVGGGHHPVERAILSRPLNPLWYSIYNTTPTYPLVNWII